MDFNKKYPIRPALRVTINFSDDYKKIYKNRWESFKEIANNSSVEDKYISIDEMATQLCTKCKISKYTAQNICEIIMASIMNYKKKFKNNTKSLFRERHSRDGQVKYSFNVSINSYFAMTEKFFNLIEEKTKDNRLYLTNIYNEDAKKYNMTLGIMEAMSVLSFKMEGGESSQIYIHINQIKNLKYILDNKDKYYNRILGMVASRHKVAVKMLTYIYEGNFDSNEIWDLLEDYFLGKLPHF